MLNKEVREIINNISSETVSRKIDLMNDKISQWVKELKKTAEPGSKEWNKVKELEKELEKVLLNNPEEWNRGWYGGINKGKATSMPKEIVNKATFYFPETGFHPPKELNLPYGWHERTEKLIIDKIKEKPQDWKIEEEHSADPYFDSLVIKNKSGWKHYQPKKHEYWGFSRKGWVEIKNALNSQNSDKKELVEKKDKLRIKESWKNSQQNLSQTSDNKDNIKNVYYGVGAVSLVLLLMSIAVVSIKKRKLK